MWSILLGSHVPNNSLCILVPPYHGLIKLWLNTFIHKWASEHLFFEHTFFLLERQFTICFLIKTIAVRYWVCGGWAREKTEKCEALAKSHFCHAAASVSAGSPHLPAHYPDPYTRKRRYLSLGCCETLMGKITNDVWHFAHKKKNEDFFFFSIDICYHFCWRGTTLPRLKTGEQNLSCSAALCHRTTRWHNWVRIVSS